MPRSEAKTRNAREQEIHACLVKASGVGLCSLFCVSRAFSGGVGKVRWLVAWRLGGKSRALYSRLWFCLLYSCDVTLCEMFFMECGTNDNSKTWQGLLLPPRVVGVQALQKRSHHQESRECGCVHPVAGVWLIHPTMPRFIDSNRRVHGSRASVILDPYEGEMP